MKKILRISKKSEKGASMLEYALLAALIAVAAVGALTLIGTRACSKFSQVGSSLA